MSLIPDAGSPETTPFNKSPNRSLPNDSIPADAPKRDLREVADGLKEQGAPVDPGAIDPLTGRVEYEPLVETQSPNKRNKFIAGGAIAAVVATVVGVLAIRGGEEDPSNAPRTPSASAPVTPGTSPTPEQPMPSSSPSEQVSVLEQQRMRFERLQILPTGVSAEELNGYKNQDPQALDLYKGVNGGEGLFPNITKTLIDHNLAFGALKVENFEDALDRYDDIITGSHYDVVDGKLDLVPNASLMANGEFRTALSKQEIVDYSKDNGDEDPTERETPIHIAAAGMLVGADDSDTTIELAAELLKAESRVSQYLSDNPDEAPPIDSDSTNAVEMISSAYALDVSKDESDQRLDTAGRLARGEIQTITIPNFDDARIVRIHETVLKTADGKTDLNVLGVSLISSETAEKTPFVITLALLPAEHTMRYDTSTKKFTVAEASADQYYAFLVAKTYASGQ